jgi:hypothetical protein
MPDPPLLWDIETDPVARRHEAHRRGVGCGGLYQGWCTRSVVRGQRQHKQKKKKTFGVGERWVEWKRSPACFPPGTTCGPS